MATCDPNTTILPCWACKSDEELWTAMLVFLCRWKSGETGGSCDPQVVATEGACWSCRTNQEKLAAMTGLLCDISAP